MLTMITGTPGAGKSLYTVWEIARKVPGSFLEVDGEQRPRRLLSNIKNLLLDHEVIGGDQLNTWHTWARPGDVIIFDEVQEVWRPRAMGVRVPDCIAALETHRHLGVDIYLVTQHPLLVDPNIRRLVNQHLHLRRVTRRMAMVYEWDHCSNISAMKSAIQSRLWYHPKAAYGLYKSAQAHTKPTQRLPRVVWFGVAALLAAAVVVPNAASRLSRTFGDPGLPGPLAGASAPLPARQLLTAELTPPADSEIVLSPPANSEIVLTPPGKSGNRFDSPRLPEIAGCIVSASRACECLGKDGSRVPADADICASLSSRPAADISSLSESPREVLPSTASELDLAAFVKDGRRLVPSPFF